MPSPARLWSGAAMEAPIEPDADQARDWAREELSKRVYEEAEPGLLDRFWARVSDWLNELFEDADGLGAGPGVLVLVLAAVVLVAVAILVIRPRLNASAKKRAEVFAHDVVERATDHRTRADQAAAENRWNEALAEYFRAMVRSAEERVIFDARPARTAAEAGTRLAAAFPDFHPEITWIQQRFDEVLYGKGIAADADYRRASALDTALEAARPASSASAEPPLAVPQ
ncbi:DUF4129 domain-containing protein [Arthrobacter sp. zg-Y859]|uniref:DUF4129 domain-containing protein n=1 Tax=Arthrobacter jinronghuae TaxID=2964609 RepID=A0ABT1NP99_9MICC|nr:DUF4129 domain-containing protein [Arthrobacter jinronghuae]MCQ1949470.1 DUF4129 domain-containing protein [Arthrobacter jinronghuae]UWX77756.1 DUF4129 domain-containing protein [Arthrobacter jinronghuae]